MLSLSVVEKHRPYFFEEFNKFPVAEERGGFDEGPGF